MTDNNDTLLREVEEELRREQWEKVWKDYGTYIMVGAALIVAAVGGRQAWQSYSRAQAETAGAKFQAAITLAEEGKSEEAKAALKDLAESGPTGFATLSSLNLAASHLKDGKDAEALAVYENLSKNAATPRIANFARLQAAALKLGDADFTEMQNRLNDLAADTSPWRIAAKELLGTAAYKAGKNDEAKKILTSLLGDPATPRAAVERINIMMSAITAGELASGAPDEAGKPAETPAAAPAATEAPASSTPAAKEEAPAK